MGLAGIIPFLSKPLVADSTYFTWAEIDGQYTHITKTVKSGKAKVYINGEESLVSNLRSWDRVLTPDELEMLYGEDGYTTTIDAKGKSLGEVYDLVQKGLHNE